MLKAMFRAACTLLAVALLSWPTQLAQAEVFFTTRDLLSDQFRSSARVSFVHVKPTTEQLQRIEQRLGRRLPKRDYTFYVASTGGKVDGYALFDEERGQHEPISFATFFDADAKVTRVEIVAYREPYGDGIRAERFRRQFLGKSGRGGFALDRDVDAISGATISSRSMCIGVQRASVLLEETLQRSGAMLAAR
jgi:electron transport complex protein RnfG